MTESTLLIWLFVVPMIAALAEFALGRKLPSWAGRIAVLGATTTFGLAVGIVCQLMQGARLTALGRQLFADPLAGFVALIISFVGWATTLFAYPYLRHQVKVHRIAVERLPVYFSWSMVFISTMTAATVNNNLIMMYVLVEATTLASAVLVSYYWKPESLEAGYKYLLLCSVGITLGLLGCVVIYSAAVPLVGGHDAMLITEIVRVAPKLPTMAVLMAGVLVIVGFGSKAGLVPFHAWLPDTYSQAPVPVTALLSGVAGKVAIYAVARIVTIFYPGHSALATFGVIVGLASMLIGIVIAYQQTDLKRMLAYSSISQIGYIFLGFGISSYLGFYGAIYHLLNHGISKAMMFLCCGALIYSYGTTDIRELGTRTHSRFLMICFFIGALGIGGMPPLAGFWSKFAIYVAAGQAHLWWPLGIALFTSLLTLAVLIRAGANIFMQKSGAEAHGGVEAKGTMGTMTMSAAAGTDRVTVALTGASAIIHGDMGHGDTRHGDVGPKRLPAAMSVVIVIMTLLVIATGMNLGFVNRMIDLSVRALLAQMGGG